MADILLENTNVFAPKEGYSADELRKKFEQNQNALRQQYEENIKFHRTDLQTLKKEQQDTNLPEEVYNADVDNFRNAQNDMLKMQRQLTEDMSKQQVLMNLLDKYDNSFASLYQIKQQEEFGGDGTKCKFKEVEQKPAGIITQDQHYEMGTNPDGKLKQLALEVDLPTGEKFDFLMPPYNKPGADNREVKAQISFEDKALQELNAEKMARILKFCESHGLSTFQMDIPYSFDGNIDAAEKIKSLLQQVKEQTKAEDNVATEKEYSNQQERAAELDKSRMTQTSLDDVQTPLQSVSPDLPAEQEILNEETIPDIDAALNNANMNTAQKAKIAKANQPKTLADAEKGIEKKFLEGGLRKTEGFSYFKEHTGWFGHGWTEYIVYDKSDSDNRKKDGKKDKNGEVKFTYSFKLFVKQENGKFRFAYRTPGNKKIDDSVVNGMVGQFKDLGITHVRFPKGLQDAEKKLWRIALAENGLVPVGLGLDRAKAEGMLKAAKEKLTAEAYSKYRYKLALQMNEDNHKKGKVVSPSEQEYIDNIIASHKYAALSNGYNNILKSMLRKKSQKAAQNDEDGAVDKCAAYMAMQRVFEIYDQSVGNTDMFSCSSNLLSNEEKEKLKDAGLNGPVMNFSADQMGKLYEILLPESKKSAKAKLDKALIAEMSRAARRNENVVIKEVFEAVRTYLEGTCEDLQAKGLEEITFPKVAGGLKYDKVFVEHPELKRKPTPQQNNTPQNTPKPQNKSNEAVQNESVNPNAAKAFINTFKDKSRA